MNTTHFITFQLFTLSVTHSDFTYMQVSWWCYYFTDYCPFCQVFLFNMSFTTLLMVSILQAICGLQYLKIEDCSHF